MPLTNSPAASSASPALLATRPSARALLIALPVVLGGGTCSAAVVLLARWWRVRRPQRDGETNGSVASAPELQHAYAARSILHANFTKLTPSDHSVSIREEADSSNRSSVGGGLFVNLMDRLGLSNTLHSKSLVLEEVFLHLVNSPSHHTIACLIDAPRVVVGALLDADSGQRTAASGATAVRAAMWGHSAASVRVWAPGPGRAAAESDSKGCEEEVRLLMQLRHPHVLAVFGLVRAPSRHGAPLFE